MSRAGARLYPLTAFVHLPYSPTIPIIAAKAKENYENYVGRPSKSCQNSDTIIEKIDTKKELAKIAGVSHDTIAREKMPSVENAVGRVQGSGPPHYSGIRFGIRFRGADPITSDQYCRVPRIRAAASGRVEP